MIYLINPNWKTDNFRVQPLRQNVLQVGKYTDNYSRIVITDVIGNVTWSMRGYCRLGNVVKCAGKKLLYNKDILSILNVDLSTINETYFPEFLDHKKIPNKLLFKNHLAKSLKIWKKSHTISRPIVKAKYLFTKRFESWAYKYTRYKKDVKDLKTLPGFILYLIFAFLDGKSNWVRLQGKNGIISSIKGLNLTEDNISLGKTLLATNKEILESEFISTIILNTDLRNSKVKLTKVNIIGIQQPVAFGRKRVLKQLSKFGITFNSGEFNQEGKKITPHMAYKKYKMATK